MSELSVKARELVSAGKGALRPSDADRDRVFQALQGKLGGAATGPGDATAPLRAAPAAKGWALLAMGVVGAGIVGTLLVNSAPPDASPAASASSPAASLSTSALAPVEPPAQAPEPKSPLPVEPNAALPQPSSRRAPDRLAEEVAILARAAADLRGGRAADALSALNEHQSKFPKGALTQERRAARAEALCALGRVTEARAELSRLPKSSPQAVRAAAFCDKRSRD